LQQKVLGISNHFYVIRPESYTDFGEITQLLALLRRSKLFKVTEFGNNRKLRCDFYDHGQGAIPVPHCYFSL